MLNSKERKAIHELADQYIKKSKKEKLSKHDVLVLLELAHILVDDMSEWTW